MLKFFSANEYDLERVKKSAIIKELQSSSASEKTALKRSYQTTDKNGILALKEVISRRCFGLKDYLGIGQQVFLEFY
ncbi:MAG: hypothetical protein KJN76_01765 [Eudoraea sp.]|nr:hypothetical protein [Eudoraea sp.]